MLLADRGYDADWIRELTAAKGAWANTVAAAQRATLRNESTS
jgi:transposase